MKVLRLARIFIPLLLVAAIVAGIVVVLTSRSELQSSRRAVEDTWTPLRTGLDERYVALALANNAVRTVPGPLHAISTQVTSGYADWQRVEKGNNVSSQVNAANNLEALGRRLVLAARAAPRLTGQTTALAAMAAYAARKPPPAAESYNRAVDHFESERNRPARSLAASLLGYDSIPTYAVATAS